MKLYVVSFFLSHSRVSFSGYLCLCLSLSFLLIFIKIMSIHRVALYLYLLLWYQNFICLCNKTNTTAIYLQTIALKAYGINLAGYPFLVLGSGHMYSGILGFWPNLRLDIGFLAKPTIGCWIFDQIYVRITDTLLILQPDIRLWLSGQVWPNLAGSHFPDKLINLW